jgi:hypothetical protein
MRAATALAVLLLAATGSVQEEPDEPALDAALYDEAPPDPTALAKNPDDFAALLEEQGLVLDLQGGSVSARAGTLHDRQSLGYPIEFLVVTESGRTHEAAFLIRARPSVLDACLRAIGAEPGDPTLIELKDPQPPEAEIAAGRASPWTVIPAHGPLIAVTVSWTDDVGVRHEHSLESLLVNAQTGEPLTEVHWIYTGSRVGKLRQGREVVQRFLGDIYGNVIAIWLDGSGTSLLERNSLEGLNDALYTISSESMPPRDTPVVLTFSPTGDEIEPSEGPVSGPMLPPDDEIVDPDDDAR